MRGPHACGVIRLSARAPATEKQMAISIQKRAMRKSASTTDASLCALLARSGIIAMLAIGGSKIALCQTETGGWARPVVGGGASLPGAALIYPAQGGAGPCRQKCSRLRSHPGRWDSPDAAGGHRRPHRQHSYI